MGTSWEMAGSGLVSSSMCALELAIGLCRPRFLHLYSVGLESSLFIVNKISESETVHLLCLHFLPPGCEPKPHESQLSFRGYFPNLI